MMKGAGWLAMFATRWKRAAVALLAVWVLVSYLVISPLRCADVSDGGAGGGGGGGQAAALQERLRSVSEQLDTLRAQHAALLAQIKHSKLGSSLVGVEYDVGPSAEYEAVRRRLAEHTRELGYYLTHELGGGAAREPPPPARLQDILDSVEHRKSVMLADHARLAEADGHAAWREAEARDVSALVQRRLRALQNPPDCAGARKLVCNLNKGCGFGCQLHHIAYCLIFAYATERTLVLNSRGWRYDPRGWDRVFYPLSDTCTDVPARHVPTWPENMYESVDISQDEPAVFLPFIDSISQKPKFLPLAIPKDLAHRIVRFNGDPASWWVGQMLKYILRPREHIMRALNETIAKINYHTPIVGVHIRRTDKVGTEAALHHIHEYMRHVMEYWRVRDLLQPAPAPRRVYLASDDPKVLEDARAKYPAVQFVGDADIARTAATHRRYTPASLTGLLIDLTLLARADYLVCTFSSQVGRVAYELMQANRADAAQSVFSLDDIYYFGGQNAHDRRAALPHEPRASAEIAMQEGDLVGVAGNHWNGYGRGTNRRTNQNGLIPWYKTVDHLVLYPFPEYKHVSARERDGDTRT